MAVVESRESLLFPTGRLGCYGVLCFLAVVLWGCSEPIRVGTSGTGGTMGSGDTGAGGLDGTGGMFTTPSSTETDAGGADRDAASPSEAGVSADTGADTSLCPSFVVVEGDACPSPNLECPGVANPTPPLCDNYGICVCGADGLWTFIPTICD